jgi:PAS domain S-box-containing protein
LTHSPPSSVAEVTALSRDRAAAAFDAREAPRDWLNENARLVIASPVGVVVSASPAILALFRARDREALEVRLLRGEGPSARRLRHLMATLPIDGPPRLEPMRVVIDRRPVGVNLRCVRIGAAGGATWLLASVPALGASNADPRLRGGERSAAEPEGLDDSAPPDVGGAPPPNSRFLWTLDEEGRFGAAHPTLVAAVGANAPSRGESVEACFHRAGLDWGDELVRALGERRTFSGVTVAWPLREAGRRRLIALSAAPLFGRRREFLGYRGFGVLGQEIEAAVVKPIEPNLDLAPTDRPEPEPAGLSDSEPGPTPPETGEAMALLADALEAEADASETDSAPIGLGPEFPLADETPPALPERSAEIYVLRHPAPAVISNIVPIRPGALDALARESAPDLLAESVELSRSERDAFREIARALVGRAPASRDDSDEWANVRKELGIDARSEQPADREGPLAAVAGGDDGQVQRNAGAVLDRLPVGVLIARDGRSLYANRTLLELAGYRDFAEFQAANAFSRMFRDRDPRAMAAEDAGAVAIVRADGQILSVDGHAQAIGWDGAPATLIAMRRLQGAELRTRMRANESEAPARSGFAPDLQTMLDRATDGAVTLDSAARILSLNEPAERLFGYHQNEIAGESLLMLLAPQSHPETTARLESLSRGGEAAAFRPLQVVGRDRDGASLPLTLTLARIGPSEAPQFCALARDLSRERETERRLAAAREAAEAASAAKTDFLAQVSHEIRTPLHAILGFAEVMLEERFGPVGNDRYKDYIKDIHASGAHVMSLADDLLDLSKIEAGKLELAFVSVDANSVIRECVSLMQPQAARERVIMRVSLHDRLPRVMVDERSLKQIMLNLMSNAVKFNEPGGQVIVSTAVDAAGQAVIRVRDTGVGMNENEVGLALTPFSQVGKTGAKGGAGLGLPLTKALVEANKAEFSIKSRREQGTLIEIAFPNIQAAQ